MYTGTIEHFNKGYSPKITKYLLYAPVFLILSIIFLLLLFIDNNITRIIFGVLSAVSFITFIITEIIFIQNRNKADLNTRFYLNNMYHRDKKWYNATKKEFDEYNEKNNTNEEFTRDNYRRLRKKPGSGIR